MKIARRCTRRVGVCALNVERILTPLRLIVEGLAVYGREIGRLEH